MRYIIPIDLINTILVAECFIKYVFKLYRLSNCLYQLNNTGELYPGARNTYSIVCSFRWW